MRQVWNRVLIQWSSLKKSMYENFGQVINKVGKIRDLGLKYGKGFGKKTTKPHPFREYPPPLGLWTNNVLYNNTFYFQ